MGLSVRTGTSASSQAAVPSRYVLPFEWGDLGVRLVREGAVDRDKLVSRFSRSPALPYLTAVLDGRASPGSQEVTAENADVLLDLLWAFGLANRNPVLLDGPIGGDKLRIGGYASTGGWTLARGDGPSHFAASDLVALDPTQQARVESLAKRIYRPCCNNPTWFPDCNHGMAMLGLLELMAARGTSEQDMARAALGANTRWFPQQYQDLARLLGLQGKRWEDGDPLELLGDQYSSAGGVQKWRAALPPSAPGAPSSGGCAA